MMLCSIHNNRNFNAIFAIIASLLVAIIAVCINSVSLKSYRDLREGDILTVASVYNPYWAIIDKQLKLKALYYWHMYIKQGSVKPWLWKHLL